MPVLEIRLNSREKADTGQSVSGGKSFPGGKKTFPGGVGKVFLI